MARIPFIPENAPFNPDQRAWLNGFLAGLFYDQQEGASSPAPQTEERIPLLILFGSQTGTAEGLAKKIGAEAGKRHGDARVLDMNAFQSVEWKNETRLLIVTSTWGDGEPPDNAVSFWNFLNSESAPHLGHLHYSVLALGDRNYASFCGAGKKFDERLEALGAKRVHARADCDVDYETKAQAWIDGALKAILECGGSSVEAAGSSDTHSRELTKRVTSSPPHSNGITAYDRKNPFPARLVTNRRLNGARSAKDTRHFEISLEGSGLSYEVGDALGVMPRNSPLLVDELLVALRCDGEEGVKNGGPDEISLRKALLEHCEIRQVGASLLQAFAERANDAGLRSLLNPQSKALLEQYLHGREVIDLLCEFPTATFAPAEFVTLLRKLTPRLYSISSSLKAHPGHVHLTVAAVRYEAHGRKREGVCSTYLADRVDAETPVGVFVQTSHGFRLPADGGKPIIMIGPGTGIAPFRAFLEERRATGANGKNWLFFGDQRRDGDFLYQEQLAAMKADGFLTNLHTAFSRDRAEKVYVQNHILENSREVWEWLEAGAHVYVCGDAKRMAKDVDAVLHEVIQVAGSRSPDGAAEYVQKMKTEKRYQRDVY